MPDQARAWNSLSPAVDVRGSGCVPLRWSARVRPGAHAGRCIAIGTAQPAAGDHRSRHAPNRSTSSGSNCSTTRRHHFQSRLPQPRRRLRPDTCRDYMRQPFGQHPGHQSGIGRLHAFLDRTQNLMSSRPGRIRAAPIRRVALAVLRGPAPSPSSHNDLHHIGRS